MTNLLNRTDIATVFLDNELCVRRFTLQVKAIIKFIASDVGRPITDLASDLIYPGLVTDARSELRTLNFSERALVVTDDRCFNVRVMPYRTMDNREPEGESTPTHGRSTSGSSRSGGAWARRSPIAARPSTSNACGAPTGSAGILPASVSKAGGKPAKFFCHRCPPGLFIRREVEG